MKNAPIEKEKSTTISIEFALYKHFKEWQDFYLKIDRYENRNMQYNKEYIIFNSRFFSKMRKKLIAVSICLYQTLKWGVRNTDRNSMTIWLNPIYSIYNFPHIFCYWILNYHWIYDFKQFTYTIAWLLWFRNLGGSPGMTARNWALQGGCGEESVLTSLGQRGELTMKLWKDFSWPTLSQEVAWALGRHFVSSRCPLSKNHQQHTESLSSLQCVWFSIYHFSFLLQFFSLISVWKSFLFLIAHAIRLSPQRHFRNTCLLGNP